MRKFIAIQVARSLSLLSKITKRGSGSALPGLIAQKIDPHIISKLSDNLGGGIIIVTGTNGKTTTSKMIAAIMEAAGHKVIYNFSGSNLSRGIASFLIQKTNFWGTKIDGEVGLFEVDEATMPEIVSLVSPSLIVITNLFRDQLDRYGEVDKTASIIRKAIETAPSATLLLNGDDPLVSSLGIDRKNVKYYGLETNYNAVSSGAIDTHACLVCGHEYNFSPRYFGHLGNWECPNCKQKRPTLNFNLKNLTLGTEGSGAIFNGDSKGTEISVNLPGLYNLYNALAASSVAVIYGIPSNSISYALTNITAAFGRMEKIAIGKKNIFLMLVKNPIGFTQSLETLTFDKNNKNLLFILNDNFADGTDISWIWDSEIEIVKDLLAHITTSGIRSEDITLRLKYAGIDLAKVNQEKNLEKALDSALEGLEDGGTLYVLPTYTAMLELRRILLKRGLVKGFLE